MSKALIRRAKFREELILAAERSIAAGGLAAAKSGEAPHIILFPEITFDRARFLA